MNILTGSSRSVQSLAVLLIRLMVGIIFFVGGCMKAFGWFGGMGLDTTLKMFHDQSHINAFWAYISIFTELIGGLFLGIGLLTRLAALGLTINMAVAVYLLGTKNFFLGGAAYPALLMVCAFAILLTGPMDYSMDRFLVKKSAAVY